MIASLGLTDIGVGLDTVHRRLVLSGSDAERAAVRDLVRQLDQPLRTINMSFVFIRGDIVAGSRAAGGLPQALSAVEKALADTGFSNMSVMATFAVRCDLGKSFETTSQQNDKEGGMETLEYVLHGAADMQPGGGHVQLEVGAYMKGGLRKTDGPPVRSEFQIETGLSLPLDKYVVLAAAPSTTDEGSAVALAVRVTMN